MSVLLHSSPYPYDNIKVSRASGAMLFDENGSEILDLTSGFGVAALGYSNPYIISEICKQIKKVSHAIPSLINFENEQIAGEKIVSAMGLGDSGVVLTTSGAEAVEVALKTAFLATGRPGIVVLSGGYHGQSLGTLRVNAHRSLVEPFRGFIGEQAFLLPYPEPDNNDSTDSVAAEHTLQLLEQWLFLDDDCNRQIGALLIEPMQNLAGYRSFSNDFMSRLTKLCRKAGVVLISDEIFTGFGRCGEWYVSEIVGLSPDIICVGKAMTGGVPGGACVASMCLLRPLFPKNGPPLHAPTFYNAPIVNAAMSASIDFLKSENLVVRAKTIEKLVQARLKLHIGKVPGFCGVRGMGAAQALVFKSVEGLGSAADFVTTVIEGLLERGVLALNSGFPQGDVVSICPPLVISDKELNYALSAIEEVFKILSMKIG